jgi:hypothetical protein
MGKPPTEEWSFVGKHQHRFEPPDLYFCRLDGDVSKDEILAQIYALHALAQRAGHSIFWLADVRNMGILTAEARRAAASASSTEVRTALRGTAIFGAGFSTRVMVTLLSRAVRLLDPSKLRPLALVETEAEARAFLNEHRKR